MAVPRDSNYTPDATDYDSPAIESISYSEMRQDVVIAQDCYVGTRAVIEKDTTYLKRFGAESDADYNARLSASKFWNAFRRSVNGLVGLKFRKPLKISDDVPGQIKELLKNADLQGAHIDVFAKERDTQGMIDGHSFIYVDMPQAVMADNPDATREDERATPRRPYFVPVNKLQVISWFHEQVNGVDVLQQVVIWECIKERAGRFGEVKVDQYRVLEPGKWEIWRKGEKDEWYLYEEGVTSLSYIPLVPFYAMQTGYFESTPPLLDVAHENIRHFNLQSGLDRILDLCNVPTPVLKGRPNPEAALIVGNGVIDVPVDGDAKFLEPTGNAIATTQNEIDRCKTNIASLGLLLLSGQPTVTKTATETNVQHIAETSELGAIARNLQDCLNRCKAIMCDYLGIDDAGTIEVNRDFIQLALTAQEVLAVSTLEEKKQISLETFWAILEQGEWLPDGFNKDDERAAVDMEKEKAASLTGTMLDTFSRGLDAGVSGNSAVVS